MNASIVTASSSCRLSNEAGRALLSVRGHHMVTDSPPVLGGLNESANPVELMLSALAACAVFVCERAAQEWGFALTSISATAAGDFDPRGVCGESVDPKFQAFRVRLVLEGIDAAQAQALIEAFKTRCPVYCTLSRSAPIEISIG